MNDDYPNETPNGNGFRIDIAEVRPGEWGIRATVVGFADKDSAIAAAGALAETLGETGWAERVQ